MVARKPNKIVSVWDGIACIDVSSAKFPNYTTIVDESDLHLITSSPRRWYVAQTKVGAPYVVRNVGSGKGQKTELLHRLVLGLTASDLVGDHENSDTLDNTKSNLRKATHGQNVQNQRGHRGSSSKYLGVSWCKRDRRWRAYCQVQGKHRALGSFQTEVAAARAYDEFVRHDPFANLNFPLVRVA